MKFVSWGKKIDFDFLIKVLSNKSTVEKDEPHSRHRGCPEHIVAQKFDYDCGGAAVSTLLLMLQREEILKTDVYKRLDVNPIDGTKSEKIKELFDEEGIAYLEISKAELGDVERVIAAGGVCLISYQAWGEPEEIEKLECGHYSILFDIDKEDVWLIDPSADEEYTPGTGVGVVKRSRHEFEKLWIDKGVDGTVYERWLLAVRI